MSYYENRTLVLNVNYVPLSVCSVKRALVQYYHNVENERHGYEIVEFYEDRFLEDTRGRQHEIPCVVRTPTFIKKRNRKGIPFNRRNVYIRDAYMCAYCHNTFHPMDLTLDHVIPRCRWREEGSPTVWTNIVTCCFPCNNKKGDKTVKEAGLVLKKPPERPGKDFFLVEGLNPYAEVPQQWEKYLSTVYEKYKNKV